MMMTSSILQFWLGRYDNADIATHVGYCDSHDVCVTPGELSKSTFCRDVRPQRYIYFDARHGPYRDKIFTDVFSFLRVCVCVDHHHHNNNNSLAIEPACRAQRNMSFFALFTFDMIVGRGPLSCWIRYALAMDRSGISISISMTYLWVLSGCQLMTIRIFVLFKVVRA